VAVYATCKQIPKNQCMHVVVVPVDFNVGMFWCQLSCFTHLLNQMAVFAFSNFSLVFLYTDSLISAYRLHIQPQWTNLPAFILLFLSILINFYSTVTFRKLQV
jgi:hypothetical protein